MRQVPEYNLLDPSTWYVMPESDVLSPSDRREFEKGLLKIAGLNQFNQPNLVLRWGVTHLDPMLLDGKPKYYVSTNDPVCVAYQFLDDTGRTVTVKDPEEIPAHKIALPIYNEVHLGERRFIVEVWRSPEFLKASGRYRQTFDPGECATYFECRNCHSKVPQAPHTLNLDIERTCPSCGSHRVSPVDVRTESGGRVFADFPGRGCYDLFYRIERKNGTYHPPDTEALEGVRLLWEQHKQSFSEKDRAIKRDRERDARDKRRRRREIWHPDNVSRPLTEEEMCL